jgi:hypothetical protein
VHSGNNAPADLAVAAKFREVNSGNGERVAVPEWDKLGSQRLKWRRALVPGSIVLLGLAVIFLIKIVGAPPGWWPL